MKKNSFWIIVVTSVSSLMVATGFYYSYQSEETYAQHIRNRQESHSLNQDLLQISIQSESNNQNYISKNSVSADAPIQKIGKENKPSALLATNQASTEAEPNNSVRNQIPISNGQSDAQVIDPTSEPSFQSLGKSTESTSELRSDIIPISTSPIQFSSIFNSDLAHRTNSEFSKKKFCSQLKWYAGITGGIDSYSEQRDYSETVKSHLSILHYNLENSKLISSQVKSREEFNIGVNGGARLFDRLDIEGGLTYHQTNSTFENIYQNLLLEEYTYIEWVPTGESGGPNGQLIYEPKNVKDFYYISEQDTVTTQANNFQLEVPLLIRYNFHLNRFSLYASVGSSAIVYSSYFVNTEHKSSGHIASTKKEQFGLVQLNALLGAGISYRIMGGLELKFEPLFRPVIQSNDEFLPEFNSNSASFNAGLTYRF